MHGNPTILIVVAVVALIFLLIVAFLAASVIRRVWNSRTYEALDALRQKYRTRLQFAFNAGRVGGMPAALRTKTGSLEWRAVEDVLLGPPMPSLTKGELRTLFRELGYTAYYEKRIASRNVVTRAAAVDKLGRMDAEESLGRLIPLLDETDPEIVAVTVRALSRIGSNEGLLAIIDRLPKLLGRTLVTRKAMETALLKFGRRAVDFLTEYHSRDTDPWIMSCVLETLSYLPPDTRSAYMALEHLASPNAEVRSKALKVLGRSGSLAAKCLREQVLPLLEDPVWFVRLQAVKTAKEIAGEAAARPIGRLLFDVNWRVRSEAALVLAQMGDASVDVFLDALRTTDAYAKESICEEIQRTRLMHRLIEALGEEDDAMRSTSEAILRIMIGLRFSTPLAEFLAGNGNERVKDEVRRLFASEAA
jgi:HEAT repeat protein